jgi:endonuclease YncB( thermonuclease family)
VLLLILIAVISAALHEFSQSSQTVAASGLRLQVRDGDSFDLGPVRLRLRGIDAPEYRQSCTDANGAGWACGKAARANLEKLLREPGLTCDYEVADRYGRELAQCRTQVTADIAAAQVEAGFALSHEFAGMRDYPDEEDAASVAKRGIWAGKFTHPEDWRNLKM